MNTIISSIGVYLPSRSFSTSEVMDGCSSKFRFPLEKITGIKSRPMAAGDEFSLDLAKKATINCLEQSSIYLDDIDLLICCNISRYDGPGLVSMEPCTSVKLRKLFGLSKALAFDIANACAGVFTGIYIADALLRSGAIEKALIVSGEFITHLTKTAQSEIENFMDPRLACLTLGDAGVALMLEKGPDDKTGFQELDLVTLGAYSKYCIAKATDRPHGGFIMHTDPINLSDKGIKYGASHAIDTLRRANWDPKSFQHLLMHQTSTMTLNSAQQEINRQLNATVCHSGNTLNNLEHRGNSASTSHFVAIADNIKNRKIMSGDRVVFGISASGLTVGTALYTFDELPNRMRNGTHQVGGLSNRAPQDARANVGSATKRLRIAATGTVGDGPTTEKDSLSLASLASNNCIMGSPYHRNDIDLVIYCGVYRNDYVLEPAYASLLAGQLQINALDLDSRHKTLAFDIFNGAVGFLNACYVAQQIIASEKCKTCMIAAAEIENNAEYFPDRRLGLKETASAILLDSDPSNQVGFSRFIFKYDTESIDAYRTYVTTRDGKPFLNIEKDESLESRYIAVIVPAVAEILASAGLDLHQVTMIFPPQVSTGFTAKLREALGVPAAKYVDLTQSAGDRFTSSAVYGLEAAVQKGLVSPGDVGLFIAVGSGIQVGCALYHF